MITSIPVWHGDSTLATLVIHLIGSPFSGPGLGLDQTSFHPRLLLYLLAPYPYGLL